MTMRYIVVHVDRITGKWTTVGPFETAALASGWAYSYLSDQSRLTVRILPLMPPDPT